MGLDGLNWFGPNYDLVKWIYDWLDELRDDSSGLSLDLTQMKVFIVDLHKFSTK